MHSFGSSNAHFVRQDRHGREESGVRDDRLQPRPQHVPVTLQMLVFEVQRLVAQGRSRPRIGERPPGTPGESLVLAPRAVLRHFSLYDPDFRGKCVNRFYDFLDRMAVAFAVPNCLPPLGRLLSRVPEYSFGEDLARGGVFAGVFAGVSTANCRSVFGRTAGPLSAGNSSDWIAGTRIGRGSLAGSEGGNAQRILHFRAGAGNSAGLRSAAASFILLGGEVLPGEGRTAGVGTARVAVEE